MKRHAPAPLPLGDGREPAAAKLLDLSPEEFRAVLPRLFRRGFPLPDETTGRYDLDAIVQWRKRRHPALFHTPLASNPGEGEHFARPRIEAVS